MIKKTLNRNIDSYSVNTLYSIHENTWGHTGGPITQTINHFGINPNHRRSVKRIWKIVIICIEQGVKYKRKMVQKVW